MKKFFAGNKYIKKVWQLMSILSPFAGLLIFWNIPKQHIFHGPVLCIFKRFFKVECPGCGMVRAFYSVVHFDFPTAWQYNRMVVIVFPLLSALVMLWIWKKIKLFLSQ